MNKKLDPSYLPPHNEEAEQHVLGSLLMDKDAMLKIVDFLQVKDFYNRNHQMIYDIMLELYQKSEPIDILSISNRLKEKKLLKDIGGSSYLTALINSVSSAGFIVNHAKIIQKKRILRDLMSASYDIAEMSHNETNDIDSLLDNIEQKIFGISQESLRQEFIPIKNALTEAWERIEMRHKGEVARGVLTGFQKLDNHLAGLQPSDLIILAARPSLGKTSLALNIAKNAALKNDIPVGIFSLEMSKDQVVDRLIASEAKVDLWRLRTGNFDLTGEYNDFARIRDSLDKLSKAKIFIDDAASPDVLQMKTMARRLQAEHGLGLIIVDYLQLIKPRGNSDNPVQQITEISRSLKALAKELNVPVIALSQLSRAVEQRPSKIPRLSDLRDSGSIEQDADLVLFIYREEERDNPNKKKSEAQIIIAKHRNGPVGKVNLYFNDQCATFNDITDNYAGSEPTTESGIEIEF
ncbi:MAG: Primary replicative DNA helicase [Parcubacteria group bacterium GW2011_GWD2_38_12]|nr:MAG: Primary replicative DNA helicase [Parcubacteria group bacterium GW2011_GWC2_36_17]KKQ43702.1 MAG: Primary replicative DNA helicase [Parcubacteria group bacterium GW2011_GWE2_37_8]KKQ52635.1 MAG: Primary replicative DNA helicase [Parcubacteria group bacterium GW2011_GWD2_38_12]KKQ58846.1 MAG: Primary replicative DNA helicase [Parcubacteria group bacterium GW2011_GWC1_38_17]KKQ59588.1 MAG: Primary replicative DNA helicase [Parcubacteria group bacterium GW2011_GWD1_38_16]